MSEKPFYSFGDIKLGYGHFELPPILIGTLFYQGQTFVDRKSPEIFNPEKAKKRIEKQKSLALQYKIPDLVEISATTPKAMIKYIEFYLDHFKPPFVLGGTLEARIEGISYLKDRGISPDEYIYNTISNLKNKEELALIKSTGIKTIVVLILASSKMTSTQRFKYVTDKSQPGNTSIVEGLHDMGVERILIDGGVVDIESLAHILETQRLISTSLKLPVGTAPTLFLFKYSSPRLNIKFHTRYRKASIMFIASWFSNFLFYGAIEDATECFAAAYQSFEFKKTALERNIKFFDHI